MILSLAGHHRIIDSAKPPDGVVPLNIGGISLNPSWLSALRPAPPPALPRELAAPPSRDVVTRSATAGPATSGGNPLASEPDVTLSRPFVIVPGYNTKSEVFTDLLQKLTADGRNGGMPFYVRNGAFFKDRECSVPAQPGTKARVFVVVFNSVLDPPRQTSGPLGQCLAGVRQISGCDRLDVQGYSMGGLATRLYLDQGGQNIGKLLTLGTPNRGARLASFAHFALHHDVGIAGSLGLTPAHLPALEALLPESMNPFLKDLNSRWTAQRQRLDAFDAVGAGSRPTLSGEWNVSWGDGVVEAASAAPPQAEVKLLTGNGDKRHEKLNSNPEVFAEMRQFFGWATEKAATLH